MDAPLLFSLLAMLATLWVVDVALDRKPKREHELLLQRLDIWVAAVKQYPCSPNWQRSVSLSPEVGSMEPSRKWWHMFSKLICFIRGHKTVRTGIASHLCLRCDKQVFDGPVEEQGRRWGNRKYEERRKENSRG